MLTLEKLKSLFGRKKISAYIDQDFNDSPPYLRVISDKGEYIIEYYQEGWLIKEVGLGLFGINWRVLLKYPTRKDFPFEVVL